MFGPLLSLVLTAGPPQVALLCTPGDGDTTELRFQPAGAELSASVASFTHVKRATALGALVPGTRTVLAIAQTLDVPDTSFASSLVRLEPGKPAVTLADRVAISSRPLITPDGRVFVQRGRGEQVTIDEVNPRTGATRTVHAWRGFTAFLAGAWQGELVVYRVGRDGADLVAIHRDALGVRTLVPKLRPMARDFAQSGAALFFTTAGDNEWLVQRLDLKTSELGTVARGPEVTLLPTPLPTRLAISPGAGEGLRFTDGALALLPQGRGFDRVRFVSGGWAIGLNEVPSDFPTAFAAELETGRALGVAAPRGMRLDVAGMVE